VVVLWVGKNALINERKSSTANQIMPPRKHAPHPRRKVAMRATIQCNRGADSA
jgi:hypothetical protein